MTIAATKGTHLKVGRFGRGRFISIEYTGSWLVMGVTYKEKTRSVDAARYSGYQGGAELSVEVDRHALGNGASIARGHRADGELLLDLGDLDGRNLGHVLVEDLAGVGVAQHLNLAD